jgi:hypothetical protein
VPLLLRDIHIEMRTLGAELLAVFTRVQSQADSRPEAIQTHVSLVCIHTRAPNPPAGAPAHIDQRTRTPPGQQTAFCTLSLYLVTSKWATPGLPAAFLQVCRAAQAALSADRKEQKLQEAAERRRAGDKLAVPNPLDLVVRRCGVAASITHKYRETE